MDSSTNPYTMFESYERGACTVELHYDESDTASNPRGNDNLGTIITWGRDGGWGDEDLRYEPYDTDYSTPRWAVRVRRERGATVMIPLRFVDYGSSGATVRECKWDDANAVIFDTPRGREMTGVPTANVREGLLAEVAEMAAYVNGECYGYVVLRDAVIIESCWGFIGEASVKNMRADANAAADRETAATAQLGSYEVAH